MRMYESEWINQDGLWIGSGDTFLFFFGLGWSCPRFFKLRKRRKSMWTSWRNVSAWISSRGHRRPPGFSGSGWVTSRVSVAQAIGEWCLTAGEICREKYEMMRWWNEWPVLLSFQLQKSLMKDETSYYPNVIANHHFSHGHRFPKWGYPKSPWVSIPVVMVIHDDWGYSRHVPGDEEHHRCGRCLWHGAPARWLIPAAGELCNGLEVMLPVDCRIRDFDPVV